jgi:hypothetical protein
MSGFSGQVGGASHKKVKHQRLNQLARFYERVSSAVQDADEIAIIGPGLAKKSFGYAVGSVGFLGAVAIIIVGHLVTIPTALALAEIATNQRVFVPR